MGIRVPADLVRATGLKVGDRVLLFLNDDFQQFIRQLIAGFN